MFISYIIEAVLATAIIIQTCWHNWKHRTVSLDNGTKDDTLDGRFIEAADTFLNNAIVFLLSLVVALLAVSSHETIVYNGMITKMAYYFSASAIIAVASMPRRGSGQNLALWIVLLVCLTLLVVSAKYRDSIRLNPPLKTSQKMRSLLLPSTLRRPCSELVLKSPFYLILLVRRAILLA
jgi:hypothetical protein